MFFNYIVHQEITLFLVGKQQHKHVFFKQFKLFFFLMLIVFNRNNIQNDINKKNKAYKHIHPSPLLTVLSIFSFFPLTLKYPVLVDKIIKLPVVIKTSKDKYES